MTTATRKLDYSVFERTELQKRFDAVVLERVKKGMKLLERRHGADWIDHIDPSTLNLSDGSCCVLGQVYGEYENGLVALNLSQGDDDYEDVEYGFTEKSNGGYGGDDPWDTLNEAWHEAFALMGIE